MNDTMLHEISVTLDSSNEQAEVDGGRGMAVMLFHAEGSLDSLVLYLVSHSVSSVLKSYLCDNFVFQ